MELKKKKRYGTSTRITVRFHDDEIKKIDKDRKKVTRVAHIRHKVMR